MFLKCKKCEELKTEIEDLLLENESLKKQLNIYKKNKLDKFYSYQKIKKHKIDLNIWLINEYKILGMSNTKIAKELNVSEGTIRNRCY